MCIRDRYRALTTGYFREAHGIFIVFDWTDRRSFESLRGWVRLVKKQAPEKVQIIVLANKKDLLDPAEKNWQITREDITDRCRELGIDWIQTSSKSGEGIFVAFDRMIDSVLKDSSFYQVFDNRGAKKLQKSVLDKQAEKKKDKHSGCC
eukprot:TRINITY_DN20371_c0_g1_i2.p1 TRINITY_DN20371_c0_g1~~TRINITY_DN20371_c0_g1_i2.p1  ORF type:complete len:157 (+),score=13.39 TRINITY_DN20371_c0_g1_i2:27-473(+)